MDKSARKASRRRTRGGRPSEAAGPTAQPGNGTDRSGRHRLGARAAPVPVLGHRLDEGLHHGVLPLLDVILEQPLGERFVEQALTNTDQRIRAGKSISPGFLFAALLWHEVLTVGGSSPGNIGDIRPDADNEQAADSADDFYPASNAA